MVIKTQFRVIYFETLSQLRIMDCTSSFIILTQAPFHLASKLLASELSIEIIVRAYQNLLNYFHHEMHPNHFIMLGIVNIILKNL